ncbi:MAG TPA: Stk1 family PASTA domain-containing Ser/Thr kinase [Clostridia bacterium]|nr:Stk1 family PASTA domain-containing Ser/Thr kinase [Clostridia bacterium]
MSLKTLVGATIGGRYQIQRQIGGGGMALVYKAYDTVLARPVALKILRPQYACDEDFVLRFKREALSAARLQHENIIRIFDVGGDGDVYFIVMELQDGPTLKDLIRNKAPFPAPVAMEIAFQICQAVAHAHKRSIIHRDIKPHNIIVSPSGQVKVTDFGIARAITGSTLTRKGTIVGSVHYFSPEQARGDTASVQSDIYSIGVVIYEMMTGRVPFEGDSPFSIAMKHISEEPTRPRALNPEIPREVESIILKALKKDETERYRTAQELLQDIAAFLERERERTKGQDKVPVPALRDTISSVAEWVQDWRMDGGRFRDHGMSDYGESEIGSIRSGEFEMISDELDEERQGELTEDERGLPQGVGMDTRKAMPVGTQTRSKGKRWLTYGILALTFLVLAIVGYAVSQWLAYLNVPTLPVPNVVGKPLAEAEEILRDAGLGARVIGETYGNVPSGSVISQDPAAQENVKAGRVVDLVVSKGPELEQVPDLIGKTFSEADLILKSSNLDFGNLIYEYHPTAPVDTVIDQNPKPETWTTQGTLVDLKISKGPEPKPILIRSVIGVELDKAKSMLEEAGLVVGEVTEQESSEFEKGTIMDMNPKPGEEVQPGTKVNLVVSKGKSGQNQKEITVSVPLEGSEPVSVKVEVLDILGVHKAHEALHQPGDVFRVTVQWTGKEARVKVYFNDEFRAEQTVRSE